MDYMPINEAEFSAWLQNFSLKFEFHALPLGFDTDEMDLVRSLKNQTVDYIAKSSLLKDDLSEVIAFKNTIINGNKNGNPTPPSLPTVTAFSTLAPSMAGVKPYIRRLVARIKVAPNYTEQIGADLGIVAESMPPKTSENAAPTLKLTSKPNGVVEIKFVRKHYSGVCLESRRADQNQWEMLANAISSPYQDARPNLVAGTPEVRQYRARFLNGNSLVGQNSTVATAVTQP